MSGGIREGDVLTPLRPRAERIFRFLQEQSWWRSPLRLPSPSLDSQAFVGVGTDTLHPSGQHLRPTLCSPVNLPHPTHRLCSRHSKSAPLPPHPAGSPGRDQHRSQVTPALGKRGSPLLHRCACSSRSRASWLAAQGASPAVWGACDCSRQANCRQLV